MSKTSELSQASCVKVNGADVNKAVISSNSFNNTFCVFRHSNVVKQIPFVLKTEVK